MIETVPKGEKHRLKMRLQMAIEKVMTIAANLAAITAALLFAVHEKVFLWAFKDAAYDALF
jgi:hypothetical protein